MKPIKTNIKVRGFLEAKRKLQKELEIQVQSEKNIDVNRIGSYLSGNFPPYYQSASKVMFMLTLIAEASNVYDSTDRFDFIAKHTNSPQSFFTEALSLIKEQSTLKRIADKLNIPEEVRSN